MRVEVLGSVMWSWGEVVVSGFKLPGSQEAVLKSTLGLYELHRHEIKESWSLPPRQVLGLIGIGEGG